MQAQTLITKRISQDPFWINYLPKQKVAFRFGILTQPIMDIFRVSSNMVLISIIILEL